MMERLPLSSWIVSGLGSTFVGRHRERADLAAQWESVVAGRRRAVFVGGEPGAGKTRLAAEVARQCYDDGAVVLAGTNTQDFGYPLQPFVEILDYLFDDERTLELAERLGAQSLSHLALVSPVLARSSPADPDSPPLLEHAGALFQAVHDLVRLISADAPLVLVLDNLQWAGPHTRQLLRSLVVSTPEEPILIIGTHRTTEPDRSRELTRSIADLYGMAGVSRIDLAGLDADEIADYVMAAAATTGQSARRVAAILRDHTGGNPFFIEETWRDLEQRGGVANLLSQAVPIPSTVRDVLDLRLDDLASNTLDVLSAAAIAGDHVDVDLLYDIGFEPQIALAAIDDAVAHGFLSEAGPRLYFRHALSRQVIIDRTPRHTRLQIHRDVGEALEQRPRFGSELLAALAYHFTSAAPLGYMEKAVEYLTLSAHASRRQLSHAEAAAAFERAASLTDGSEAVALTFEAARSYYDAGQLEVARRLYQALVDTDDLSDRMRAAIGLEEASFQQAAELEGVVNVLAESLRALPQDDPAHTRGLASLGRALLIVGQIDEASRVLETALARARDVGDRDLLAHALSRAICRIGNPDELRLQYDRSLELRAFADVTTYVDLGLSYGIEANAGYRLGIPGVAEDCLRIARDLERTTGSSMVSFVAYWLAAALSHAAGRFVDARAESERLIVEGAPFDVDLGEGSYAMQRFFIDRCAGDVQSLPAAVFEAAAAQGGWRPGILAVCTEQGRRERVEALLPSVVATCHELSPVSSQWAAVATFAVEAIALTRHQDAARQMRMLFSPFTGTNLMIGHLLVLLGSADRYLAIIDHVLGNMDSATRHFEKAFEMDHAMGFATHEAETLLSFAAHLLGTGDPARAGEVYRQGREIADRIGLKRRIPLELTAIPRVPMGDDLGLSPREIEVLRLLATGLSNRKIGESLMISSNTAANHVRSILMKTGATNRTQAAVFAANAGLL